MEQKAILFVQNILENTNYCNERLIRINDIIRKHPSNLKTFELQKYSAELFSNLVNYYNTVFSVEARGLVDLETLKKIYQSQTLQVLNSLEANGSSKEAISQIKQELFKAIDELDVVVSNLTKINNKMERFSNRLIIELDEISHDINEYRLGALLTAFGAVGCFKGSVNMFLDDDIISAVILMVLAGASFYGLDKVTSSDPEYNNKKMRKKKIKKALKNAY